MRQEDIQYLEKKASQAAREAWPKMPDFMILSKQRDEALRNKRWFDYNQLQLALINGEDKVKQKILKDCMDAVEMVQRVKAELPNDKMEKFNLHAIRSFLLLDMLESDLMEMKDMTIIFKTGNYNPICPQLLEDLLNEVRSQLGFVYKDSERIVIEEFVKGADKLDELMSNNARSIISKINKRLSS